MSILIVKFVGNMLPPFGVTPPPHSNKGDISGNYENIWIEITKRQFDAF